MLSLPHKIYELVCGYECTYRSDTEGMVIIVISHLQSICHFCQHVRKGL